MPVTHNLKLAYLFSLLIAALTAAASIAGLLYPKDIYPTSELRGSFLANDAVNLFIGLPILLGSMWLARCGRLIGLVATIDGQAVKQRPTGRVPERFAGGVLAGFGILYILRIIAVMAEAIASQTSIPKLELALLTADAINSAALLIGGVLLWRRRP